VLPAKQSVWSNSDGARYLLLPPVYVWSVAQLVEPGIVIPVVASSSLVLPTKFQSYSSEAERPAHNRIVGISELPRTTNF
jgi:hypothetical protein